MSDACGAGAAIRVDRVLPAPVERVWRAWTDPAELSRWWGRTEGLAMTCCEIDLRPGGAYRFVLRPAGQPDGPAEEALGTYLAVEPPHRLVFRWDWGNGLVRDTRVTVTFTAVAGGTRVSVLHERQPTEAVAKGHADGWTHMLSDLSLWLGHDGAA